MITPLPTGATGVDPQKSRPPISDLMGVLHQAARETNRLVVNPGSASVRSFDVVSLMHEHEPPVFVLVHRTVALFGLTVQEPPPLAPIVLCDWLAAADVRPRRGIWLDAAHRG